MQANQIIFILWLVMISPKLITTQPDLPVTALTSQTVTRSVHQLLSRLCELWQPVIMFTTLPSHPAVHIHLSIISHCIRQSPNRQQHSLISHAVNTFNQAVSPPVSLPISSSSILQRCRLPGPPPPRPSIVSNIR